MNLALTLQCSDLYNFYSRCDSGLIGVMPQLSLCTSAACGLITVSTQGEIMTIPPDVHSRILAKAREEWPDDFEMQKYTLDKQTNAYIELNRFYSGLEPSDFVNGVFSSALAEWPDDYDMQLHTVTKQLDAAVEFFQYEDSHVPKDVLEQIRSKTFAEWPDDYDMQFHTLKKQVAAWLSLNG